MDAQRALLDSLMGLNRDGDKPDAVVTDYRDERLCHDHLCGLCPVALKLYKKSADCPKEHNAEMKKSFQSSFLKHGKSKDLTYYEDFERNLASYIQDANREVQRSEARVDERKKEYPSSAPTHVGGMLKLSHDIEGRIAAAEKLQEVKRAQGDEEWARMIEDEVVALKEHKLQLDSGVTKMSQEMQEKITKAQTLLIEKEENDEIDAVMSIQEQVEALEKDKLELQTRIQEATAEVALQAGSNAYQSEERKALHMMETSGTDQKLRVCNVCGALLSLFDSDSRLADHFGGKLHLGFVAIRKHHARVKKLLKEHQEKKARGAREEIDRRGHGGRQDERRRPEKRSRSRSKNRTSSRGERRRSRSGSRGKDRRSDRGSDRGRNDRDRRRDREADRDRRGSDRGRNDRGDRGDRDRREDRGRDRDRRGRDRDRR